MNIHEALAEAEAMRASTSARGTGTTAARLFGAGMSSLTSASAMPIVGEITSMLLDKAPTIQGPRCVVDHNPGNDPEIAALWGSGRDDRDDPIVDAAKQYGVGRYGMVIEGERPVDELGPLMSCASIGMSPVCTYSFDEWNAIVDGFDPEQLGYEVQVRHTTEGGLFLPKKTSYWPSHTYTIWALGWKFLPPRLRKRRYMDEVQKCVAFAMRERLTSSQLAELESLWEGRFIDGRFVEADSVWNGLRVGDIPRWVPLDVADMELAEAYLLAYDVGVGDVGMQRFAEIDLDTLIDRSRPRETVARLQNLAASVAGGDSAAYQVAMRGVDATAGQLGIDPSTITREERSGAWRASGASMMSGGVTSGQLPWMVRFGVRQGLVSLAVASITAAIIWWRSR